MKRNLRVIQINGFRGLLLAVFIISCLIAGFIAFPAFLTMESWNYLALKTGSFPSINFLGGILLWAIITFSIYIFNKRKFIVSFNAQQELTENEVKDVISRIKSATHKDNTELKTGINLEIKKDTKNEINEVTTKKGN